MLGGPDRVWSFRNPWARPMYRLRKFITTNHIALPVLLGFWRYIYKIAKASKNYYGMVYSCKKLGRNNLTKGKKL